MNNKPITPRHIGIIMDGNGRWAQSLGLPRKAGHREGVEAARRIVDTCVKLRIQFLTLYVFSTENWKRPPEEVGFLMRLAEQFTRNETLELQRNGVRVQLMGQRKELPPTLLRTLDKIATQTQSNDRLILNLAINYGGRTELVDAIKLAIQAQHAGEINIEESIPENFNRFLYCPEVPDADLIIRTSGEYRLSNFLLWRSAGAVFLSSPVYWPDFQDQDLLKAIEIYRGQINRLESEKHEQIS